MLATQPVIREPVRLYMITTQTVLGVHHFISRNILMLFLVRAQRAPLYALRCELHQQRAHALCPMLYALCLRASASRGGTSRLFFTEYRILITMASKVSHRASARTPCSMPYALCSLSAPAASTKSYTPKSSNEIFSSGTPSSHNIFCTASFITGGPQR